VPISLAQLFPTCFTGCREFTFSSEAVGYWIVPRANLISALAATLALPFASHAQAPETWSTAVAAAANPQARILVIDIPSGHLIAAAHLSDAARTVAAPGSTLKPLVLYSLITAGRWNPDRRIACNRKLRIAGRSLNCSHPSADPMDASLALTWSCNTYFAGVADTIAPGSLRSLLAPTGLLSQTGLAANEANAVLRDPQSHDATRLAVLGVDYRWLALQLAAHPSSPAAQVVSAGLADSVSFGMATAASLGAVSISGKTGTASPAAGTQTHGWFVGFAPSDQPKVVIVVYVPAGHGADAARVAADLLAHSPLRHP